ncbi:MAG: PH domain-containing protein [Verrucomicrobiota bacterium]|nr:PH domain-containing protein [Verrucomicrobiota bacterium]
MYNSFRTVWEKLLRIPADPEPPPGDEQSAQLFRAAPNYYKYLLVVWALGTLGVVAGTLPALLVPLLVITKTAHRHHPPPTFLLFFPVPILIIFLLWRIVSLALVRLDFEKRWYVVTDRSLRVREGIVSVREMTVTFANIQNISVSQGPIQRAIGIADLRVDTAGGGGGQDAKHGGQNLHTAWFRGVNNASDIRALIQERLRRLKDSGLGDRDEEQKSVVIPRSADPSQVIHMLRAVCDEATALRRALQHPSFR